MRYLCLESSSPWGWWFGRRSLLSVCGCRILFAQTAIMKKRMYLYTLCPCSSRCFFHESGASQRSRSFCACSSNGWSHQARGVRHEFALLVVVYICVSFAFSQCPRKYSVLCGDGKKRQSCGRGTALSRGSGTKSRRRKFLRTKCSRRNCFRRKYPGKNTPKNITPQSMIPNDT